MPKHFDIFADASKMPSAKRFEDCTGVCITDQDAVCTITEILAICGNDMSVARDKFNNHLLFESSLGGVLIDNLNPDEVKMYKEKEAEFKKHQAEIDAEKLAFEQFKAEMAKKVADSKTLVPSSDSKTDVPPAQSPTE